jgi:hypothetical protein
MVQFVFKSKLPLREPRNGYLLYFGGFQETLFCGVGPTWVQYMENMAGGEVGNSARGGVVEVGKLFK